MQILKYFPDSPVEIPVTQGQLVLGPVSPTGNEKTASLFPCLDGPRAFLSVLSCCLSASLALCTSSPEGPL